MKVRYFFSPAVRRLVNDQDKHGGARNTSVRVISTFIRGEDLCIYMRLADWFYKTGESVMEDELLETYSESLSDA